MLNNTQNNIELKQGSSSTSTRKRAPKIKRDDPNYQEIINIRKIEKNTRKREKLVGLNKESSQLRQKYLEIYKGLEGSLKFLDNAPNIKNFIKELFLFANCNFIGNNKSIIQFDLQKTNSTIRTRARQQIYLKAIKEMEKGESIENIKNIITKILNDYGAPSDDIQPPQHPIISTSQEDDQQHSKLSTDLQPSYSDNQASNYTSQENYLQLQLPSTYHETYQSFSGNKDTQLSSPHQQYLGDNAHQYGVLPAHPNSLPKLNTWQDFNQNPIQRPIPIRPIPIQESPLPSSQYQYPSGILELNSHKHLDLSKNSPQCPSLWRTW